MIGAEVWSAAFRGRDEEREGEREGRGGADGLLLNPLVGMFVDFGPVCPRVWFTRFSGRKSFPRGDARTASIVAVHIGP